MTILLFLLLLLGVPVLADSACVHTSGTAPAQQFWTTTVDRPSVKSCVAQALSGDDILISPGYSDWSVDQDGAGTADVSPYNASWTNKDLYIHGSGTGNNPAVDTILDRNGAAIFIFNITTGGVKNTRISNIRFQMSTPLQTSGLIQVISSTTTSVASGWRIDNLYLDQTGSGAGNGSAVFILQGLSVGVIDHIHATASGGKGFNLVSLQGSGPSSGGSAEVSPCTPGTTKCKGYHSWNQPLALGTDQAVYLEDWDVDFPQTGTVFFVADADIGGRYVLRHSTIRGAFVENHSTKYSIYGGSKFEIYENVFVGRTVSRFAQFRSGTGVFFNNQVTGYGANFIDIDDQRFNLQGPVATKCLDTNTTSAALGIATGLQAWDGNDTNEPTGTDTNHTGWPTVSSIGRRYSTTFDGKAGTQANEPVYAWKNGSESTCVGGGTCTNGITLRLNQVCGTGPTGFVLSDYLKTTGSTHFNGEVDYVNNAGTAKPGYTAYTYPHPLVGAGAPSLPNAPTALRVVGTATGTTCTVTWAESGQANLAGYYVKVRTTSQAYIKQVTKTAALSAAAHQPPRQHTFQFPIAATYSITVTSFDDLLTESAAATEVTCVSTGLSRTAATGRGGH